MSGYIIRRVIVAIIVTIGIAVISFLLLHYLSPSPVYSVLGAKTTPQAAAAWNKAHGFDRSEPAQLLTLPGSPGAAAVRLLLQARSERQRAVQGERWDAAST